MQINQLFVWFINYLFAYVLKIFRESLRKFPSEETSREHQALAKELKELNDHLFLVIPEYHKHHGEPFTYRGVSYMDIMKKD